MRQRVSPSRSYVIFWNKCFFFIEFSESTLWGVCWDNWLFTNIIYFVIFSPSLWPALSFWQQICKSRRVFFFFWFVWFCLPCFLSFALSILSLVSSFVLECSKCDSWFTVAPGPSGPRHSPGLSLQQLGL